MTSPHDMLSNILRGVEHDGDFFARGALAGAPPLMTIEGVGELAYPLLPIQAEALRSCATRAPYGSGEETLVDEQVRRSWQIEPGRVTLEPAWAERLEALTGEATRGLGVTGEVEARLYKVLLYEEGGFFVPHRDTEKEERMFATLIVGLPSRYAGGELVIRHQEREVELDLASSALDALQWCAFYTDCVHELRPITQGWRAVLVYNLVRVGDADLPVAPNMARPLVELVDLFDAWRGDPEQWPHKLIVPLSHDYSPAGLQIEDLKGRDAHIARILRDAAQTSRCEAHLALATIQESGSATHHGYYDGRRGYGYDDEEDPGEFSIGEVYDETRALEEWRRLDSDGASVHAQLPFERDELCPPDALDEALEDSVRFHEATGNEGASYERSYRSGAFVIWPSERWVQVISDASLRTMSTELLEALRSSTRRSREDLRALAAQILAWWPEGGASYRRWARERRVSALVLESLRRLEEEQLLARFISEHAPALSGLDEDVSQELAESLTLLDPSEAPALVKAILSEQLPLRFANVAHLIEALASEALDAWDGAAATRREALAALVEGLPRSPEQLEVRWPLRSQKVGVGVMVRLLAALARLDEGAAPACQILVDHPEVYAPREVLAPALLELYEREGADEFDALEPVRQACITYLEAQTARPPEPPPDWRRDFDSCGCQDCEAIEAFMADPEKARMIYPAAKRRRQHLHQLFDRAGADVTHETIREGSPYKLDLVKTRGSYERELERHESDVATLAELRFT